METCRGCGASLLDVQASILSLPDPHVDCGPFLSHEVIRVLCQVDSDIIKHPHGSLKKNIEDLTDQLFPS